MTAPGRAARLAVRTLARSRAFAIIAILSLGTAIALDTTVYALIDAMIDPQLDVRAPDQLYTMRLYGDTRHRLSPRAVDDAFRAGLHGYEGVTGYRSLGDHVTVERGASVRDAKGALVRPDYFSVVGLRVAAGRALGTLDEGAPLAVISDRLAAELFPDARPVLGATIDVDGHPRTIVGIVRRNPSFPFLDNDVWILPTDPQIQLPPTLIRLRPGFDRNTAKSELALVSARLAMSIGQAPSSMAIVLGAAAVRPFRASSFHWALVGAAIAILLVACANLANLQMARGLGRGAELAVRSALGASRRQLAATLMWENVVLAGAGLALGLVLAFWAGHALRSLVPTQVADYVVAPQSSWRFVPVAGAASVFALFAAGLWPAWRIARADPSRLMRGRAGTGAHRQHRRWYAALIVVQIALALPLVSGAGLVARSAWRLESTNYVTTQYVGWNPAPVVVAQVRLDPPIGTRTRLDSAAGAIVDRMRALRDVSWAAAVASVPAQGKAVTIEGADGIDREVPAPGWSADVVTPDYFRALGRSLSAGRDFADGGYTESQVVVDAPTAHYLWPGASPVGKRIKFGDFRSSAPWARVVGVLRDARDTARIRELDPYSGYHMGLVYRTLTPDDVAAPAAGGASLRVYVRSRRDVNQAAVAVRHVLWSTPGVASSSAMTADDHYGLTDHRAREGFVALIFSIFAVLGTGLAMMGVFGIVAYSVGERRREFAVRVSLGATSRMVLRDVLREGFVLVLLGTAGGLLLTRRGVPMVATFLTGVNDLYDAPLFAALAVLLALSVFCAALVPALRATRVDPLEALRSD